MREGLVIHGTVCYRLVTMLNPPHPLISFCPGTLSTMLSDTSCILPGNNAG
jgi:hypothetical protein